MRGREAFPRRKKNYQNLEREGVVSWEEQLPSAKKHSQPNVALQVGGQGNDDSDFTLFPPSHSPRGSLLARPWSQRVMEPADAIYVGQPPGAKTSVEKSGRRTWRGQVSKSGHKHANIMGMQSAKSGIQRTLQDKQASSSSSFFYSTK